MPKFLKHSFIFLLIIGCNLNESVNKDLEDCVNSNCESSDNCTSFFDYNISIQSAAYFFKFITINEELIDNADWVGAFNGDICVGARQWDTSNCGSGVCDLPIMGEDGNELTEGYMQFGDIPTFKIYDVSEGKIYNANIKNLEGLIMDSPMWQNMATPISDSLVAIPETIFDCINY
tara:strand:- start:2 stop:529 length:528 start_codon:yes stop_codon:yes gene_type:complete